MKDGEVLDFARRLMLVLEEQSCKLGELYCKVADGSFEGSPPSGRFTQRDLLPLPFVMISESDLV
eukprot:7733639-Karenia_brevis.AAC.1